MDWRDLKEKVNDLAETARLLWKLRIIPAILALSFLYAGSNALERHFTEIRHDAQIARALGEGMSSAQNTSTAYRDLSRGTYRVGRQVDVGTWLVFQVIPGGNRDIPRLVQELPSSAQEPDALFRV